MIISWYFTINHSIPAEWPMLCVWPSKMKPTMAKGIVASAALPVASIKTRCTLAQGKSVAMFFGCWPVHPLDLVGSSSSLNGTILGVCLCCRLPMCFYVDNKQHQSFGTYFWFCVLSCAFLTIQRGYSVVLSCPSSHLHQLPSSSVHTTTAQHIPVILGSDLCIGQPLNAPAKILVWCPLSAWSITSLEAWKP